MRTQPYMRVAAKSAPSKGNLSESHNAGGRHTRSASSESMALHATMTARSVKHIAQIAVTQPTSRSFLRLPRDSMGNLLTGSCGKST